MLPIYLIQFNFRYAKLRSDEMEALASKSKEKEENERKRIWAKNIMDLIYKRLKDLEEKRLQKGLPLFDSNMSLRPPMLMG